MTWIPSEIYCAERRGCVSNNSPETETWLQPPHSFIRCSCTYSTHCDTGLPLEKNVDQLLVHFLQWARSRWTSLKKKCCYNFLIIAFETIKKWPNDGNTIFDCSVEFQLASQDQENSVSCPVFTFLERSTTPAFSSWFTSNLTLFWKKI